MTGEQQSGKNPIVLAMIIMIIAMLAIPAMDILAKWLAVKHGLSPATIAFSRFVVQTCLIFTFLVIRTGKAKIASNSPRFNMLRGVLIASASMIFFISVKYMPVADAISIFFVEPLFVMFLSSIFLGEILGWRRVVAAIIGFCGALIVIQPSYELFGLISILPLCTAILFSFYLILTRKFGTQDNLFAMQFYAGIGGVILCVLVMFVGDLTQISDLQLTIPGSSTGLIGLFSIGLIATITHLMIVRAFSLAPASTLAPFQYVEIVSATILGFLVFGDFPDAIKWVGTSIIIASGLFIFWRERKLSKTI